MYKLLVELSGQSRFKGCDGYAKLARIDFVALPKNSLDPELCLIRFWPERVCDDPPAELILTVEDLAAFRAWLVG